MGGSSLRGDWQSFSHAALFCRSRAARRLAGEGFKFDVLKGDVRGKYAEEAEFVELVVPVRGHTLLPEGYSFLLLVQASLFVR